MGQGGIRALYVVQSARLYGSQRSLLDMLGGLGQHGVVPIVAIKEEGPLTEALTKIGVPFHVVPMRNWLNNRNAFQSWRKCILCQVYASKLAKLACHERADIIHTNTFILSLGAYAAKRANIPHVWHAREELQAKRRRVFVKSDEQVKRLVSATTHAVITPSPSNQEWLKPYVPDRLVRVIPNGPLDEANKTAYRPKPRLDGRPARILVAGRLGPAKGTEDALAAASLLKAQGIPAIWKFAGSGEPEYQEVIADKIGQLEVKDVVDFVGFQSDMEPLYRECDIVAMPSHAETFGRVTAEALGYGCPLAASRLPATKEIVQESKTGLLCTPKDPQDLANAIGVLIQNEDLRLRLAEEGYRDVWGRFTRQRLGRDIAALYQEITG